MGSEEPGTFKIIEGVPGGIRPSLRSRCFPEDPVDRSPPDAQSPSNLDRPTPLLSQRQHVLRLLSRRWNPPLVLPFGLGLGDADELPLEHELALDRSRGKVGELAGSRMSFVASCAVMA